LRQEIEVTLGIRRGNAFRHVPAHHGALRSGQAEAPAGDDRWRQPVLATVAVKGEGVAELLAALDRHHAWLEGTGELARRRERRLAERTREVVERAVRRWMWDETRADTRIRDTLPAIAAGRTSPYEVAAGILDDLREGSRP
jgi:LAO/AO transport system kinase